MAVEIRQFTLTIPANTPISAPAVQDMSFPARSVDAIEIVAPAGSNGVVGFQVRNSGKVVIPYDSDQWIVTSGEVISWPLQDYITSGSWEAAGYNTGANDHAIYVRFLLSLPPAIPEADTVAPLDAVALSAPGTVPEGDFSVQSMGDLG